MTQNRVMIPHYLLQLPGFVQEEKEEGERSHPLQPQLAVMMIKCVMLPDYCCQV